MGVLVGVVASCVLCARVPRVLGDVLTTGYISRATEIAYTPPRLEALFMLSVVIILRHLYRSLQQFCGFWVLCPIRHLVRHVLHLVRDLIDFPCLLFAIHLVYVNANLFLSRKIDQLRMLSRLSLDFTATGYTLYFMSAVLRAFSIVVRVPSFKRTGQSQRVRLCFLMKRR